MQEIALLARLLSGRRLAVLTGAGCSTESGIPDYRGPETLRRARNPIRFQQFVQDPAGRARYWARSYVGWPRIARTRPNPAHEALGRMEAMGLLSGLVTQNVDRLHTKAGSTDVVELHGALSEVICLGCGALSSRDELQERLARLNPGWPMNAPSEQAPDGDMEIEDTAGFAVAHCRLCSGLLKPHVVFFGENVPKERVERAYALTEAADALLVVGTSLAVFSGFRFLRRAAARGQPIAVINLGPCRGDPLATLKVEARAGEALPLLAGLPGAR